MFKSRTIYLFTFILILVIFPSCKKNKGFASGNLNFSADTVVFDTVFTTIGSVTKQFKIYNPSNQKIKIDEITLMGGASSPFKINIDGNPCISENNIVIEGKDSLFAFVQVTLNTNGGTLPLVIEDSIRFKTNGKDQYIQLAVWGQDMYYHYTNFDKNQLDLNEGIWPNDKPHVIYGAAIVDSSKSLTIQKDTKIFLHKNAMLFVYKGQLNIQGTKDHEVEFRGDRLEQDFKDSPGQYYGLYFHQAKESTIDYAIIHNGVAGIHLFDQDENIPSNNYTLTIHNSKIYNNSNYGIWIFQGAKIKAENCLIAKSGVYGLFVLGGGSFNLNYCDILGYGNQSDNYPALAISNYYKDPDTGTKTIGYINEGKIVNSVVYGNLNNEMGFDTLNPLNTSGLINLDFSYSLFKKSNSETSPFYKSGVLWNLDPLFKNTTTNDFHFYSTSPMSNAGISNSVLYDVEGNSRNNPPDIGCFEIN